MPVESLRRRLTTESTFSIPIMAVSQVPINLICYNEKIIRQKGTEPSFTGKYNNFNEIVRDLLSRRTKTRPRIAQPSDCHICKHYHKPMPAHTLLLSHVHGTNIKILRLAPRTPSPLPSNPCTGHAPVQRLPNSPSSLS